MVIYDLILATAKAYFLFLDVICRRVDTVKIWSQRSVITSWCLIASVLLYWNQFWFALLSSFVPYLVSTVLLKAYFHLQVGFNMKKVTKGNVTIKLWDLGGQPRFRSMWERYCRAVSAIVYVTYTSILYTRRLLIYFAVFRYCS